MHSADPESGGQCRLKYPACATSPAQAYHASRCRKTPCRREEKIGLVL